MQIELNNLLWLAKRKISIDPALSIVGSFLDNNKDYILSSDDVMQLIEIFRCISQNQAKYEKIPINNFLDKIKKLLLTYFTKNDNEPQRYELIVINITSKEEIFRAISLSLISQLFFSPEKYELFLTNVVDEEFCDYLIDLTYNECKDIQQLFKTIARDNSEFCFNFVEKSLNDTKKLKLIEILINSLQDESIDKFLQLLDEPKYSIVYVYLLNELPESFRRTAMNFIISHYNEIDLNVFAKKLSCNSKSMKLFVKSDDLPTDLVLNIILKVTNNFDCFELFSFENILNSKIENSEHVLLILYYIHQKQRKMISYELANKLLEKFDKDDNLFHFYSMLISDNLFLYINEKDEKISQFLDKLLNCLLSACTESSINLYTTIAKMHEGSQLKKYMDQLFEVFLNSDETTNSYISDSLLALFSKNKKSFCYSIDCIYLYYKKIFPRDMIENYNYFYKFIYFLEKYFEFSESTYPISDFRFTPHNKSLIEDKEKIQIGTQRYEFLVSKNDTNQKIINRISFVFNFDIELPPNILHSNNSVDIEKFFEDIELPKQSTTLPPPAFFSNETKLSNILLINVTNPKVDENTSTKIANILDYMPDDTNFLTLIHKGIISTFTNQLYVKYVILLDHAQMGQAFIKSLVDYFCQCKDQSLKQDILTQMRKNLKIIASLNNIDFQRLYKSFFIMLKSPQELKVAYKDFLQFIIDNTKSQLIKYFENKKNFQMKNPPEFLWNSLLKLINLVNLEKSKILEANKDNEFGAFIAKDIISQNKLTSKDLNNAFTVLEVHYYIHNPSFYITLCQQIIANNFPLTKKNISCLLHAASHSPNDTIITNIFRVFNHFYKIEMYKDTFHKIFRIFIYRISKEYKHYDFSFDPKNYEKNELGTKFKPLPNNSPLNAILQIFQNPKPSQIEDNKKRKYPRAFVNVLNEESSFFNIVENETDPIKVLKKLEFSNIIQFEDEFPKSNKPIFVKENVSLLTIIQDDIIKCNRKFKFKGIVANIESNHNSRKYVAIVKRNEKLIKIIDNQFEVIQSIPKESKTFKINFAVYIEENKKIEEIENYQYQYFSEKSDTPENINKIRLFYEKYLLCYTNDFRNFIIKMPNDLILLTYYLNFVIRMKDVNIINEFTSNLHSLKLSEKFHEIFADSISAILMDFININETSVLIDFRKTILHDFLLKMPDKHIIQICKYYLYSTYIIVKEDYPKISIIVSVFKEFVKNKKEFFKGNHDITDILNLLNQICLKCFDEDDDNECYSILNMSSIFDSIKFFYHILTSKRKKKDVKNDVRSKLTCLDSLESNHYKIIRNKENIKSYISLVQKVFNEDDEYIDNFYQKLFLEDEPFNEGNSNRDEYFLINLVELPEKNANKLIDIYFNQLKTFDANFLFNEIEQFIKKTPSLLIKFLKYLPLISSYFDEFTIEFISCLNRIFSEISEIGQIDLLKSLLVKYEEKFKSGNVSVIDFKMFINLLKILNLQNYLSFLFNFMNSERNKEVDLFCIFFGEFILFCKADLIKASYIYDIILHKFNDSRVDLTLFILKKFLTVFPKNFFIHPRMKELYLYCIVHNQVNSFLVDDLSIEIYNFLYDIQNQVSKKLAMNNPPSERFTTIAKMIKTKVSKHSAQIKISSQKPFIFIEQSQQLVDYFGFSETISSLFNFITNQEPFDIDIKAVNALIDNILSNEEFDVLGLQIENPNKLIEIIEEQSISNEFKSHLLDLMIFSQSRDESAFFQMNGGMFNLKTGFYELDEKIFYFLTLKALYGEEEALIPILMENIDTFVNSILKITSQPVLLKKENQPSLIQLIDRSLNQSNFIDYNFENIKNILLRNILSQ